MVDIIDITEHQPHETAELICIACYRRWQGVWPSETLLKHLECPDCHEFGVVIKTGQTQE